MKVLTIAGPEKLEITELHEALIPKGDQVLVKVDRVSLCGSDYKLYNGKYGGPCNYPIQFGHEWSGTVTGIGDKVTSVKAGDRVTGDCSCWCGYCPNCKIDKNLCKNIKKFGITVDGFSSQMVLVPEKHLYVAPQSIPYKVLALTECFSVALHAIRALENKLEASSKGRTLVIGCGPIGMAVYLLLRLYYQWSKVEIYDTIPERLEMLQALLPDMTVGNSISKLQMVDVLKYNEIYNMEGYDVIFEATGSPTAMNNAIEWANPFGSVITLSMYPQTTLNFSNVVLKALTIKGSIGGTGEFDDVIGFFKDYADIVEAMVTSEYHYKDAQQAFDNGQNQARSIKVQIILSEREQSSLK